MRKRTRSGPDEVQKTQSISLTSEENGSISINTDQLVIPFRNVFLREPRGKEEDIAMASKVLKRIAKSNWKAYSLERNACTYGKWEEHKRTRSEGSDNAILYSLDLRRRWDNINGYK